MDKKTILVVLIGVAVLMGWTTLVNKLYPPKPKPVTTATNSTAMATTPTNTVAAVKPPEVLPPVELSPATPRPPEQIAVLMNEYVRVEFTSWGGGIRAVELLRYQTGRGNTNNVVLNAPAPVPALALRGMPGAEADAVYDLQQLDPTRLKLQTRTPAGAVVTKTITLGADYQLEGTIEITPPASGSAVTGAVEVVVGTAVAFSEAEQKTFLGLDWHSGEKSRYHNLGNIQKLQEKKQTHQSFPLTWVAVKNQFFAFVLTPATTGTGVTVSAQEEPHTVGWQSKAPQFGLTAAVELPFAAGSQAFSLYTGPKEYMRLEKLGKSQADIMAFGDTIFTVWGVFSVALLWSMKQVHNLIPNYGLAIVIVTIALKIILWPVQAISIRSMKEMQKFQPLMQSLREKYKDDAQRLNQEMMKLYKEHKINPFAGCLPMVAQMPVLIGFYRMLSTSVELRGASFLWMHDLARPDTVAHIAGLPLNPLPLVMVGTMIWQMKLTPQTGDAQQQKMMMFMPLMMLLFFYNSAAGLVLYWTVQQVLSIAQQWWSLRQPAVTGNQR